MKVGLLLVYKNLIKLPYLLAVDEELGQLVDVEYLAHALRVFLQLVQFLNKVALIRNQTVDQATILIGHVTYPLNLSRYCSITGCCSLK